MNKNRLLNDDISKLKKIQAFDKESKILAERSGKLFGKVLTNAVRASRLQQSVLDSIRAGKSNLDPIRCLVYGNYGFFRQDLLEQFINLDSEATQHHGEFVLTIELTKFYPSTDTCYYRLRFGRINKKTGLAIIRNQDSGRYDCYLPWPGYVEYGFQTFPWELGRTTINKRAYLPYEQMRIYQQDPWERIDHLIFVNQGEMSPFDKLPKYQVIIGSGETEQFFRKRRMIKSIFQPMVEKHRYYYG